MTRPSERADAPILHFLGLDGETSEPFYRPWSLRDVRDAAASLTLQERDVRYGVRPEDPAEAGWGVLFASGIGRDVRDALAPLLALRERQTGERFRVVEVDDGETLQSFRRRTRAGIGRAAPERLPYYLLLVGDPEQISFDFQHDLDVQHAVGRIAFAETDAYARYARSVCEHEERRTGSMTGLDLFCFDRDGDETTEQALDGLAEPLASELSQRDDLALRLTTGAAATREVVADAVTGGPSIVFTIGHSYLLRCGAADQAAWQGSLVTGSRRGEEILADHVYSAAQVPDDADLRGRIFYLYGCNTIGTPVEDGYHHGSGPKMPLAPKPFLSPLAQRLLAPPRGRGALAVVGQVERASPESSISWDGVHQIDTFVDTLRALTDGVPIGRALEAFGQRYASLAVEMLRAIRNGELPDPVQTWTAYQDARAVSLLGDPLAAL